METATQKTFDLAILDVNINGSQVYPVAETVAARGIPFAFSTGYGPQSLLEHYRDRPILRKPIALHELAKVIAQIAAGSIA